MTEAAEQLKQANLDTNVILFTMWTEAIKNFAELGNGNVIFLDGSPDSMQRLMAQMQLMSKGPDTIPGPPPIRYLTKSGRPAGGVPGIGPPGIGGPTGLTGARGGNSTEYNCFPLSTAGPTEEIKKPRSVR